MIDGSPEGACYFKVKGEVRHGFRLLSVPIIFRPLLSDAQQTRGLRRLLRKLSKTVHRALGGWFDLQIPGRAEVKIGGEARRFQVNAANVAYLQMSKKRLDAIPYEPGVTLLFDALLDEGSVVYDVGANCGYFSFLVASYPGFKGHVHAFEANPRMARDLTRAVESARLQSTVECHDFGLSSSSGTALMRIDANPATSQIVEKSSRRTRAIRLFALDDLELPMPDIIKLDVEHHELEVLQGAERLLLEQLPLIVFESWFDADPEIPSAVMEYLSKRGFLHFGLGWELQRADGAHYLTFNEEAWASAKGEASLALVPMSIEDRLLLPGCVSILAVHESKPEEVFSSFERCARVLKA